MKTNSKRKTNNKPKKQKTTSSKRTYTRKERKYLRKSKTIIPSSTSMPNLNNEIANVIQLEYDLNLQCISPLPFEDERKQF